MSPLGPFAPRREAETPDVASGQIPGLPGAPVRTPVRAGQAATSAGLWPAIAGRLITRQLWIELYGLPGYGLTLSPVLSGGKVTAFAATPRDFRPHDPAPGKNLLVGRFILAGASMEVEPPSDPWNRPSPSRPFAVELHAFNWLPALMAQGERGAREALRLALDAVFAHPNVGPFISRQLIQRLVTSNPSRGYVGRVAAAFANNGSGVRGDMKAVIRAILLDRHVLDYAAAYFQLGPIERRIYEVARSSGEARLETDLATFRLQIGYQNPLPNFRNALKQIAAVDSIPDYRLELIEQAMDASDAPRRGRRSAPRAP